VKPSSIFALATILAMGACSSGDISGLPPPAPPTPKAAASVSFDGTYRGRIQVTSTSLRGDHRNWCDTPEAMSVSIQHNAFSYVLAHPNLPPGPTYSPTFEVSVALDGSFAGAPRNGGPQMAGRITGPHIEGEIHGLGCGYAFTAEKV